MKLLRCHIENYGKLQQFDYDFTDNLNVILQENGWGKSTFASFIKSMLFGLPQTTKRSLDENERAKYTPWQGGKFGGWLEFELDNKAYRIERFFGARASSDKFAMYDLSTNQQINEPDFVQDKLGINADTFMRSTFIQHNFISPADDESIKEKLGKLVENQDLNSIAEIDEKLLDYQKSLEFIRGKGGKIYQKQTELEETITKLDACKSAKIEEEKLYSNFTENVELMGKLQAEIDSLRKQIQQVNDERTQQAVQKRYLDMQKDLERLQNEQQQVIDFFHNEPPTEEILNSLGEYQNRLEKLRTSLEELNDNRESINFQKLKGYFSAGLPTEQDLQNAKILQEKIQNIDNKIQFSTSVLPQQTTKTLQLNKILPIGFGVGAILFVLIGLIAFLSNLPLLFTFIGIGIIFAFISLIFVIKPKNLGTKPTISANKLNIEKLKNERENYIQQLNSFLEKYNENTSDYAQALENISFNLRQYNEYQSTIANKNERKQELEQKIKQFKAKLCEYYSQYFANYEHFNSCLKECRSLYERLKFINQSLEQKNKDLADFASTNQVNMQELSNVNLDITPLEQKIKILEQQKEIYNRNNNSINSRLINLSNIAINESGLNATKQSLEEEIEKYSRDLNTIKLTREFLTQAKNNLTAKYLTPLSNAFKEFSQRIVGDKFDKVSIDTSLNVMIEQNGEKKSSDYYSSGGRDVIELCMRLALAKTLFENETPPLIMDDPFNNLDDEKTQKGLDMLQEISKDFQVIYLVCHTSRARKN